MNKLSSGIGWYCGLCKDTPSGWILCKEYKDYKTAEIEYLGYKNSILHFLVY